MKSAGHSYKQHPLTDSWDTRFRIRSLGARTPIRNLYLTGADICAAGVAGAMFGGVLTASVVLGRNLMSKVSRPAAGQVTAASLAH